MIEAMLMVKNPDSRGWEGMGSRKFMVLPRLGDNIELEVDEIAYLYKVVSVHHPGEPTVTAGDIWAVQIGRTPEVIQKIFDDSSTSGSTGEWKVSKFRR
jgi:hypothetical protein